MIVIATAQRGPQKRMASHQTAGSQSTKAMNSAYRGAISDTPKTRMDSACQDASPPGYGSVKSRCGSPPRSTRSAAWPMVPSSNGTQPRSRMVQMLVAPPTTESASDTSACLRPPCDAGTSSRAPDDIRRTYTAHAQPNRRPRTSDCEGSDRPAMLLSMPDYAQPARNDVRDP